MKGVRMSFRSIALTSLWLFLAASVPTAQGRSQIKGNSSADTMFMRQAAMSSMAEVAHGQLAAKNAAAAAVKEFGGRMVDDHTKANEGTERASLTEGCERCRHTSIQNIKRYKIDLRN
jgi:putative membrane protein